MIFCPFSEAVKDYPELIKKYLGSVVPSTDNYYAALNSAVFSDGSFVYIPKNTKWGRFCNKVGAWFKLIGARRIVFIKSRILQNRSDHFEKSDLHNS